MTRRMCDVISPEKAPDGFDLYAGYINGALFAPSFPGLVARFGAHRCVSISTNGDVDAVADVYDIERGDYLPSQVPQILAAHPESAIYCNRADRASITVPVPRWIAATLDGTTFVPGAFAVQWIDRGDYDESIVYDDSWHPTLEDDPVDPNTVVDVYVDQGGNCWMLLASGAVDTVQGRFFGSPLGEQSGTIASYVLPFRAITRRIDGQPGYTCWDSSKDHRGFTYGPDHHPGA